MIRFDSASYMHYYVFLFFNDSAYKNGFLLYQKLMRRILKTCLIFNRLIFVIIVLINKKSKTSVIRTPNILKSPLIQIISKVPNCPIVTNVKTYCIIRSLFKVREGRWAADFPKLCVFVNRSAISEHKQTYCTSN